MRACWRITRGLIGGAIPFKLVNDASQFVAPIFINLLLGVVEKGQSSAKGFFFAGLMFVGLVVGTLCDNQHFQRTMRAGELPSRLNRRGAIDSLRLPAKIGDQLREACCEAGQSRKEVTWRCSRRCLCSSM